MDTTMQSLAAAHPEMAAELLDCHIDDVEDELEDYDESLWHEANTRDTVADFIAAWGEPAITMQCEGGPVHEWRGLQVRPGQERFTLRVADLGGHRFAINDGDHNEAG